MKKITITFASLAMLIASAGGNNASTATPQSAANSSNKIVGTWQIVAYDFRLDSIAEPTGKWVYATEKDKEAVKQMGMDPEANNLNFNADGSGYIGPKNT
jgi:hypothetical protein